MLAIDQFMLFVRRFLDLWSELALYVSEGLVSEIGAAKPQKDGTQNLNEMTLCKTTKGGSHVNLLQTIKIHVDF